MIGIYQRQTAKSRVYTDTAVFNGRPEDGFTPAQLRKLKAGNGKPAAVKPQAASSASTAVAVFEIGMW